MSKSHLHLLWSKYRWLSMAIIGGLTLIFLAVSVLSLRANNLRMLELREAVFAADEAGQNIQPPLRALQNHVASHMNTSLPKLGDQKAIQLKNSYDRAVAAEAARVSAERVRINAEAVAYCESVFGSSALTQSAACVDDYVSARPVNTRAIPVELYTIEFVSPSWTPDTAGISLVITILLAVVFILRLIIGHSVKKSLQSDI